MSVLIKIYIFPFLVPMELSVGVLLQHHMEQRGAIVIFKIIFTQPLTSSRGSALHAKRFQPRFKCTSTPLFFISFDTRFSPSTRQGLQRATGAARDSSLARPLPSGSEKSGAIPGQAGQKAVPWGVRPPHATAGQVVPLSPATGGFVGTFVAWLSPQRRDGGGYRGCQLAQPSLHPPSKKLSSP